MSAAIDGCLATLPDKQVNRLVEWGAKVAPWVTLTFLAVPLTVERIQETRYLMAMERQRQEIERRRRNGEPILEISRTPRADQGAPIINDASATVPTTEGVVEPTTPVSPFGRGPASEDAGVAHHDGRGRDHRDGGWPVA